MSAINGWAVKRADGEIVLVSVNPFRLEQIPPEHSCVPVQITELGKPVEGADGVLWGQTKQRQDGTLYRSGSSTDMAVARTTDLMQHSPAPTQNAAKDEGRELLLLAREDVVHRIQFLRDYINTSGYKTLLASAEERLARIDAHLAAQPVKDTDHG